MLFKNRVGVVGLFVIFCLHLVISGSHFGWYLYDAKTNRYWNLQVYQNLQQSGNSYIVINTKDLDTWKEATNICRNVNQHTIGTTTISSTQNNAGTGSNAWYHNNRGGNSGFTGTKHVRTVVTTTTTTTKNANNPPQVRQRPFNNQYNQRILPTCANRRHHGFKCDCTIRKIKIIRPENSKPIGQIDGSFNIGLVGNGEFRSSGSHKKNNGCHISGYGGIVINGGKGSQGQSQSHSHQIGGLGIAISGGGDTQNNKHNGNINSGGIISGGNWHHGSNNGYQIGGFGSATAGGNVHQRPTNGNSGGIISGGNWHQGSSNGYQIGGFGSATAGGNGNQRPTNGNSGGIISGANRNHETGIGYQIGGFGKITFGGGTIINKTKKQRIGVTGLIIDGSILV